MSPARAQEHKAHTYRNTTHGEASCITSGIHYPLFITRFLFWLLVPHGASYKAGFPLPTPHKSNTTSKLDTARRNLHSTQICMLVSGHRAQSTKNIKYEPISCYNWPTGCGVHQIYVHTVPLCIIHTLLPAAMLLYYCWFLKLRCEVQHAATACL